MAPPKRKATSYKRAVDGALAKSTAAKRQPASPVIPATPAAPSRLIESVGIVYDAAAAELLCRRIAEGESLQRICRNAGMPSRETVRHWLDTKPDFSGLYARARRHQAESLVDAAIDTAHEALAHDNAASVRVKIDAMLKLAAQLSARLNEVVPAMAAGETATGLGLANAILAARARLARRRKA